MSAGNSGNMIRAANERAQSRQNQEQPGAAGGNGGEGRALDVTAEMFRDLAGGVMNLPHLAVQRQNAYMAGIRSAFGPDNNYGMSLVGEAESSAQAAADAAAKGWKQVGNAKGALGKAGATINMLMGIEQALSGPFSLIKFPAMPAVRVLDFALGLPHGHLHPPTNGTPLPSIGPVIPLPWGISGAEKTTINGRPAARCGDLGIGVWCGGYFPMYEILLGSSSVWIEGWRAARVGVDLTFHCLMSRLPGPKDSPTVGVPLGFMISASDNVIIGGFPLPSLLNLLLGGIFHLLGRGVGKLGKFLKRQAVRGAQRMGLNKGCGKLFEPIDVVTGANVDEFIDFTLPAPRFIWRRWYNSQQGQKQSNPLGWGFKHEYQHELRYDELTARYTYTDLEDNVVPFPSFLSDTHSDQVVQHGYVLTRLSERRYELTTHDQPAIEFEFHEMTEPARLVRLRDEDRDFAFEYDEQAQLVGIQLDEERTVHLTYSPAGLLNRVLLERSGQETVYVVRYRYDDEGCLIEFRDAFDQVARYEYDRAHRMTRKTDRRGYSYRYCYDEQGRCVYTSGDDGFYEGWLKYHPEDRATVVEYSDGGSWIYEYNELRTITRIIDPYGGEQRRVVDPDTGIVTRELDPAGNPTELLYDENGALTGRRDSWGYWAPPLDVEPNPPDPLEHKVPETPLEWELGNLLTKDFIGKVSPDDPLLEEFPEVAAEIAQSQLTASVKERPPVSQEKHDLLGRLIERWNEDGSTERWEYDAEGNEVLYVDGDGGRHRKEYVSWNLLDREIDPDGNSRAFKYSPTEKITQFVDAEGTVHDFKYDKKDRLVEVWRNGIRQDIYRYDEADNLIEKMDGDGRCLLKCVPGFGRLDRVRDFADGEVYQYEYNERGRITRARTCRDRMALHYDEEGRSTRDERNGLAVENEFDDGELISTTVFEKFAVEYVSWDEGSLDITDPTGRTHTFYISDDGLVLKGLANGTRELVQYDAQGRCLRKIVRSADGARYSKQYSYSAAGDLLRVEDSWRGKIEYHCDAAHRLKIAEREDGRNELYAHDKAGNLIVQPGLDGVKIGAGNKLKQANGERFSYDHRDNVVMRESERKTTSYEYDSFDQLVGISLHGREWQADYDALGRRTRKRWSSQTTEYYWDHDRLSGEIKADGSVRVYVYADDCALVPFLYVDYASLEAAPEDGIVKYLFTNHLGVPERVEDDSGRTIWQGEVSPYGLIRIDLGRSDEVNLRFPGHYYDCETGLHYNRFRYYDPVLGCYLQCDPLGIAGGYNLYAYITNPLTDVDILGLSCTPGRADPSSSGPMRPLGPIWRGKPNPRITRRSIGRPENRPLRLNDGSGTDLRRAAMYIHSLSGKGIAHWIARRMSTVAIVRVKLRGGTITHFASKSGGRKFNKAQRAELERLGIPPQNILEGPRARTKKPRPKDKEARKEWNRENHAERNIDRNLPEGATVTDWGISYSERSGGRSLAERRNNYPCLHCEPFVEGRGGMVQGEPPPGFWTGL